MYVCICNAITDKQIRAAAEAGATDLWGLKEKLGVATNCGSCKRAASEILAEYRKTPPVGARTAGDPKVHVPSVA
jgi:bacterioferritin-associated ferredoxin